MTKFAVSATNYEQVDAMFGSVNELLPQVFDAHALSHMLGKHCSSIFVNVWFCLVLAHALGIVLLHCIRYDCVCSEMGRGGGNQKNVLET